MKIVVLGGGASTERDVSLRSASAVAKALRQAGFIADELDPKDGLQAMDNLPKNTIVFPVLHGQNGEDGSIQAELEKRNLPYLGTDSQASANCYNKWKTRQILVAAKVPVANGELVTERTYRNSELAKRSHVLKVTEGGSSIGTYVVRDPSRVEQSKVDEVFSLHGEAVVEELVEGTEITVPVLDNRALPVIEIRPPEAGEFDYENKYNGASEEICPPVSIDEKQQKIAQELAVRVHKTMGCRHLSRTDIIVRPDGSMAVLEINTIPGMTDQSLFPLAAKVAGTSMVELVKQFVKMVERDYKLS